jgi:hypothetical protein
MLKQQTVLFVQTRGGGPYMVTPGMELMIQRTIVQCKIHPDIDGSPVRDFSSLLLTFALILSIVTKGIAIMITVNERSTFVNFLSTINWSTLVTDPHGLFITLPLLHTNTFTPNTKHISTIIG